MNDQYAVDAVLNGIPGLETTSAGLHQLARLIGRVARDVEDFERGLPKALKTLTDYHAEWEPIAAQGNEAEWIANLDKTYVQLSDLTADYVQRLDALQARIAAARNVVRESAEAALALHSN